MKNVSKYFVRGCSPLEGGRAKNFVEKVAMSWAFILQKVSVLIRP